MCNYTLKDFKFNFAKYLVDVNELKSIETYRKKSSDIIVSNTGIYYGVPNTDEKLKIGLYYVINVINENVNTKLVLLYKNKFKVLINDFNEIDYKETNYIDALSEFLIFCKKNNICYKKIILLFDETFNNKMY